jgi:hypothetical protein
MNSKPCPQVSRADERYKTTTKQELVDLCKIDLNLNNRRESVFPLPKSVQLYLLKHVVDPHQPRAGTCIFLLTTIIIVIG